MSEGRHRLSAWFAPPLRFARELPVSQSSLVSPGQPEPSPPTAVLAQPRWVGCPADGQLHLPDPLVDGPIPESPVISRQEAGRVLCELFLTNAEQGNHAVNDELVAELVHRIRTAQHSRDHHNSPPPSGHPTDPPPEAITMTEHDPDHLLPDGSRPPGHEEHRVSSCDDAAVLLAWITLSRVADGRVTQQGGAYLDGDAPLPPYLAASVPTLLTEGSLAVADPDPTGWQQLTLTDAGQTRYEELRRRGLVGWTSCDGR